MKSVFADTFFYLALINEDDAANARALAFADAIDYPVVTTAWVLAELADSLCSPAERTSVAAFIRDLCASPGVIVVPANDEDFHSGLDLYARRADKAWLLTDCISFVVMKERGISDALTGDHHFAQAGFNALLR